MSILGLKASPPLFILCLLLAIGLQASAVATRGEAPVRVICQLTDLHISKHETALPYGKIAHDLGLLAEEFINPLSPDVLLITGDAVDSKQINNAGRQNAEEALVYEQFLARIHESTTVLTVPGNHEKFDTGLKATNGTPSRLSVKALTREGQVTDKKGEGECPAAILVGIDASPRLGLRSPANFLALMTDDDVRAIEADLGKVNELKSGCEVPPVVIGFSHYPLSVFSQTHSVGLLGAISHALGGIDSLDHPVPALLARTANVYLSGHLHALFGQLHRVHASQGDVDGGRDAQHRLTELESAAWKDDRRIRVMVVDSHAKSRCMSFTDYYFLTPSSPRMRANYSSDAAQRRQQGWEDVFDRREDRWGLTSEGGGFSVDGTIALVTWPPDASYALCTGSSTAAETETSVTATEIETADVRAVVLTMSDEEDADISVTARLTSLQGGQLLGSVPLTLESDTDTSKQRLFVGAYDARLAARLAGKPYLIHVEVEIRTDDGSVSRTVAASVPRVVTPDGSFVPLEQNLVEFVTLYVNWSNLAHRVYLTMIVALLGVLISLRQHRMLIGYVLYQVVGPLYPCRLLSQGWPFVAFQHGVVGYVDGRWISVPTADTLLVATMHFVICIVPMTMWVIVFGVDRGRDSEGTPNSVCRIAAKWGTLGLVIAVNFNILWMKLVTLSGWVSLLSPITAGVPIFVLFGTRSSRVVPASHSKVL